MKRPTATRTTATLAGIWTGTGFTLTAVWLDHLQLNGTDAEARVAFVASLLFGFLPVFLFVIGRQLPLRPSRIGTFRIQRVTPEAWSGYWRNVPKVMARGLLWLLAAVASGIVWTVAIYKHWPVVR